MGTPLSFSLSLYMPLLVFKKLHHVRRVAIDVVVVVGGVFLLFVRDSGSGSVYDGCSLLIAIYYIMRGWLAFSSA